MKFKNELNKKYACSSAVEWVGNKTRKDAWKLCQRGDWMLWYYAIKYPENIRELTLAKGYCANTVRHLMKDKRSKQAVDVAIQYGKGEATKKQLIVAAAAAAAYAYADAYAYAYAADAAYAASYAASASAASYAASAAAYAAYAASAAAYAADAASYAAAYAAAIKKENQLITANICRQYLKII